MSVSKALNSGEINEWEFAMLLTLQLGVPDEPANIDHKMEAETGTQVQKRLLEEINDLKKALRKRCLVTCAHFPVCYLTLFDMGGGGMMAPKMFLTTVPKRFVGGS